MKHGDGHLFTTITNSATIVVFITLLLSWQLSLIAVVCTAFIPFLVPLITHRAKALGKQGLAANETLSQHNGGL
jgi:ABC-type transport system involved in cytochrome bd biosynthesis fused ATPase/permease subunit